MRIIGLMIVGPGEADRYLEASLKELKRLCDDAVIATNNADTKSIKLIQKYGFWHYEDNREWGIHQPSIKTSLLQRIGKLRPDWIIALDSDEVFCPEFTREIAEELTKTKEIAWYFMIVNLYNDREHFAHDVGIQRFWNIRFFKYLPQFGLEYQKKSLHCGLAPPFAYNQGWHAPYYIEHFGLMKPEDRLKKAERYRQYDPKAKFKSKTYYDDLTRELTPHVFNRQGLLEKLRASVDCKPRV